MSGNPINDIKLIFNANGTIDLEVSPTGDIALLGDSVVSQEELIKRNAIQIIKFLILTPLGSIKNPVDGSDTAIGSEVYKMFGEPIDELSSLFLKSYIQAAMIQATFIDSINTINIRQDRINGIVYIDLDFTINQNSLRIPTTITLNV